MEKRWKIKELLPPNLAEKFPEMDRVILQLLYNRGLTKQSEIDVFLGPDYERDQHNPFLFRQMKKAVKLILVAIEKQRKIVVYGDYDADGVTSTALLYSTLKKIGADNLSVYIPNRLHEGYGLNMTAVEELGKQGTELIITVDCGITNVEEVKAARQLGMQVIVTDHHLTGKKLPVAEALICPTVPEEKYPFKNLAGVGVAFKLAQALLRSVGQANSAFEKWLLDLVAIGTIADMVPLLGENRTLAKWGLLVLGKTQRLGLRELIENAGIKKDVQSYNVGFQIAPRLNAAGRMDHANTAYELLITDDEAEAMAISNELNEKNRQRQKVTEEMIKISLEQIGEPAEKEKILFSQYDGWSPGLVGLAAGRLCDRFNRPVIVFGKSGDKYVGSGRSIEEFDITKALAVCAEYLEDFGGHKQACGLTIIGEDNLNKFKEKMGRLAKKALAGVELKPSLSIEAEISLRQANWDLVDGLSKFEPFGEANPEPLFLTRNLEVDNIFKMGTNGQHLKLMLRDESQPAAKKFVGFNMVEAWFEKLAVGDKIDVVYRLGVNEWNGNREIEFRLVDIRKH